MKKWHRAVWPGRKAFPSVANSELNLADQFVEGGDASGAMYSYGKRPVYDFASERDAMEYKVRIKGVPEDAAVIVPKACYETKNVARSHCHRDGSNIKS